MSRRKSYLSLRISPHPFHITQAEQSSGLYLPSCYYVATTLLEAGLNAVNGAIYATILYNACDYSAFVQPDDPVAAAVGYVGIFVLTTVAANVCTRAS